MAHEIFISHSSKDKQIADAICHYLEHERLGCWIAPRDVRPGANFAGEIVEAIPRAKVMLLILSSNSNVSQQVLRELELAVKNDLIVIPVRIEDMIPTGSMSFYMSTMQWIDFFDPKADDNLKSLATRIKNILGVMDVSDETLHNTENEKKINSEDAGSASPRKKTLNKKALITAITATMLLIAAGIAVFLLRDRLFDGETGTVNKPEEYSPEVAALESKSIVTLTPDVIATNESETVTDTSEEVSFVLNMEVAIEDDTLREAVYFSLEKEGNPVSGNLKVADMLKLKKLIISKPGQDGEVIATHRLAQYYGINISIYKTNDDISSFRGLEYAKNLEVFIVFGNTAVTDLSPISGLENLIILALRAIYTDGTALQLNLRDLNALTRLTNLKVLTISDSLINDFNGLRNMEQLEYLEVNWNLVEDISPILQLKNIDTLSLSGLQSFTNWDTLSGSPLLKNVSMLDLANNPNISDLSFLAGAERLTNLQIQDCPISDISILAQFDSLEDLNLREIDLDDVSILESLYTLKYLEVSEYTYINNSDTMSKLRNRGCNISY